MGWRAPWELGGEGLRERKELDDLASNQEGNVPPFYIRFLLVGFLRCCEDLGGWRFRRRVLAPLHGLVRMSWFEILFYNYGYHNYY
jgi:hypothetical protein